MILIHELRLATQATQAAQVTQASLLPIAPILLLPFILVFFVVVVPIWGVALGILGLVLLIVRGCKQLAHLAGSSALDAPAAAVHRAFRWVLTFAGFTERGKTRATAERPPAA